MPDQTTVDFRPNPDGTPNSWLCNNCSFKGTFTEARLHIKAAHRYPDLRLELEAQGILIAQLQQENAELARKLAEAKAK